MSDFLSRLVERTRGAVSRVEPLIPSRFATAGRADDFSKPTEERIEAAPEARTSSIIPRSPTRVEFVEPPASLPHVITKSVPGADSPRKIPRPSIVAEPEELLVRDPQLLPSIAPVFAEQQRPARENTDSSPGTFAKGDTQGRHPSLPVDARSATQPRGCTVARNGADHREAERHEPPVIRVTIGRIEVRAASAPVPAQRAQRREPGPKLSLDAYLKERKEGAR